ncbi:hypothetical protein BK735_03755 [Bacillus mycoides]|uniref:Uncharacterized protein n=1 Tax=Bacillus thuringiensis serovar navarrensis TaxID=339658 RepID=A0A243AB61_BACTU|nr:hypothetical protein BLW98_27545 [Bacillus mycoides]OTY16225.1 hypothetical protein BK732_18370 [Bacillus thuringiensis serovar navarrensis]OTY21836.1 hypothetical protein BK735_03755 [Bacillus mycoides]PGA06009.1 hypothetical protein COL71_25170 [Bacillus mycoides]
MYLSDNLNTLVPNQNECVFCFEVFAFLKFMDVGSPYMSINLGETILFNPMVNKDQGLRIS